MRLCLFLVMAGVLDAILTHLGIASGVVEEGNPAMKLVIDQSWFYFYMIKICLPLMLLGLFFLRPLKGWSRALLISTCVLYFSVLVYHMVWIVLYFKTSS
ncbi:hypothetical protein BACCIP111895_04596 [Neobacillus rhizosphaerae]|uniref:DUF5658 domain-containing protein n=1 Tax=Neobacillus rhizosphaerae TaxID=2880965 RepID=A0ABN8KUL1_9BACI|nr:DUF5658 family protein [Neobacillus rhizosphaerae]CAH2717404.1 hypothetical protein BACCIP111895_04596 [Neobacillus rhizosphaerae]